MRIGALLVDDEIGAINTLRGMLNQYCPQIQIAGIALSVREAVEAANATRPELVFLDIEMPPVGSGFDFLQNCGELEFGVIFTTAYPQYAIKAINEVQPWAYLVKPYSVSELKSAVAVAEDKIRSRRRSIFHHAQRQSLIVQDSRKGRIVLHAGDIVYCRAEGSFTDIFVWKNHKIEKITSSRNLGEYELELSSILFARTHHSFLVNLQYVERFERTGRNGIAHLRPAGHRADVSVAKMDSFASRLDHFCQNRFEGNDE